MQAVPRAALQGSGLALPELSNGAGRLSPLLLKLSACWLQFDMSFVEEFGLLQTALHAAKFENLAPPAAEPRAAVKS